MVIWLVNILNVVVDMEVVPSTLKSGIVVLVYKGGGKNPVLADSYRGVTLSSVFAKVKRVSCDDDIFATQEVIARYLRGGGQVFMCLYDM